MNRFLRIFSATLIFTLAVSVLYTSTDFAMSTLNTITKPPVLKILPTLLPPTELKSAIIENLSGGNTYQISWKDNSRSEVGFVLERTPSLGAPFVVACRYPANATSATFAQEPGTVYYYQLRAYTDNGQTVTDPTNAITIEGPPFTPTNFKAVTGPGPQNGILLTWDNPPTNSALTPSWVISRDGDGNPQYFTTKSTSYLDESVKPSISYSYRVWGMTAGGRSPLSDTANLSILNAPTQLTAGIWPSISGKGKLNISWNDNSQTEEGYRIYILRKYADSAKPRFIEVPSNTTRYDYDFDMVVEHEIKVQAFMKSGKTSTWSNAVLWTPTFLQKAPPAPKIISINAINGTAEIAFEDEFPYTQTYKIERKDGYGSFLNVSSTYASEDLRVIKDSGLKNGTTYTYRMIATNGYGGSPYSNEMKITTASTSPPTQPNAPPLQPAIKPLVLSDPAVSDVPGAVTFKLGSSKMVVKGIVQDIDPGKTTKPVVTASGRTLIPIKSMVEEMGGTVEWFATERKVLIKLNDHVVELIIGDKQANVNGTATLSEEAPQIINGRTMLPLRFVGESLGLQVEWDSETQNITILP